MSGADSGQQYAKFADPWDREQYAVASAAPDSAQAPALPIRTYEGGIPYEVPPPPPSLKERFPIFLQPSVFGVSTNARIFF